MMSIKEPKIASQRLDEAENEDFNIVSVKMRPEKRSLLKDAWRRFRRNRLALAGSIVVIGFLGLAVFGPAPYDPTEQNILGRFKSPSFEHLFGTDRLGRDLFSRVVLGARISLGVSFSAVIFGLVIGTVVGLAAGWLGRRWDWVLMRLMDTFMAFPPLLLAVALVAVINKDGTLVQRLTGLVISIGLVYLPFFARLSRGGVLRQKKLEYIEGAYAIGQRPLLILLRHILPNITGTLIVQAGVFIGQAIIVEASLSFLGLGLEDSIPTWGGLLLDARRDFQEYPHLLLFPGLIIALAILSFTMVSDGLRDALDPKTGT